MILAHSERGGGSLTASRVTRPSKCECKNYRMNMIGSIMIDFFSEVLEMAYRAKAYPDEEAYI